ncbi:MAG TPA: hypothetical protein VNN18_09095 [Candidatus Xenobia bacterium]|nr:hypothetical protein [Candidatus Xenobia bacterium]
MRACPQCNADIPAARLLRAGGLRRLVCPACDAALASSWVSLPLYTVVGTSAAGVAAYLQQFELGRVVEIVGMTLTWLVGWWFLILRLTPLRVRKPPR